MSDLVKAKVNVNLHVELTEVELAERAEECAKNIERLEKKEGEFKEIRKKFNGEIKELRGAVSRASLAHVTGKEPREVDAIQHWDLDERVTWYEFGGKEYEKREMSTYEVERCKQKPLFGDGPDLPNVSHETLENDQKEV